MSGGIVRVAAAVIVGRDGRVLLAQRPFGKACAGYWEFPGGKLEPGESAEQAIVREVREELGVNATPLELLETVTHDYAHGTRVEIVFVKCSLDSHVFVLSDEVHDARWQLPADIEVAHVLEADRDFLRALGARD